MEIPHVFDDFFQETSIWFLIFMLVSFLIGLTTGWWMRSRQVRFLRRQFLLLQKEALEVKESIKTLAKDDPLAE